MGMWGAMAMGALSFVQARDAAKSQAQMTEYEASQLDFNAELADLKAQDAIDRGKLAVDEHNRKTNVLIGKQRARLAGQGIDVEDGSALEVQEDTRALSALDALTIKNNAWRESMGYKLESHQFKTQATFARIGGDFDRRQTLLTGGMKAAGYGMDAYDKGSRNYSKRGGSRNYSKRGTRYDESPNDYSSYT